MSQNFVHVDLKMTMIKSYFMKMLSQEQQGKQGRYWPCNVLGDFIDEHFGDKNIGVRESLKQTINDIDFCIYCQKKEKYVAKIMSSHGTVPEVEDHQTFWIVGVST